MRMYSECADDQHMLEVPHTGSKAKLTACTQRRGSRLVPVSEGCVFLHTCEGGLSAVVAIIAWCGACAADRGVDAAGRVVLGVDGPRSRHSGTHCSTHKAQHSAHAPLRFRRYRVCCPLYK
jgi:hypothetical protein